MRQVMIANTIYITDPRGWRRLQPKKPSLRDVHRIRVQLRKLARTQVVADV